VDWKRIQHLPVVGVDEVALKKGHRDFSTWSTFFNAFFSTLATITSSKKGLYLFNNQAVANYANYQRAFIYGMGTSVF
jgi:hypothetical protein